MAKQELRAIISADARAFMRTMGRVKGVALSAAKLIGGAAAAGAAAYGYAVKSTANELDKLAKLQARTGAGAEWLQRMAHAADLSDVSLEGLQKSFVDVRKRIDDVGDGKDPFARYGLSGKALAAMRPEDQMQAVLEHLAQMPKVADRSAAAIALLGKSGTEMLPMLTGGVAGFRALQAERDKLGPLFKDSDLKAAEAFNDSLTTLGRAARVAMGRLAATQFAPLTRNIEATTAAIVRFVKSAEFTRLQTAVGTTADLAAELARQFANIQPGQMPPIAQMVENINQALTDMRDGGAMNDIREAMQGLVYVGIILSKTLGLLFKAGKWVGLNLDEAGQNIEDAKRLRGGQFNSMQQRRESLAMMGTDTPLGAAQVWFAKGIGNIGAPVADLARGINPQTGDPDTRGLMARVAAATEAIAQNVTGRQ